MGETRQLDQRGKEIDRAKHSISYSMPSPMPSLDQPIKQVSSIEEVSSSMLQVLQVLLLVLPPWVRTAVLAMFLTRS